MATAQKTILIVALGVSLSAAIVVPIVQSRRKEPPPQPKVERDMLGWPLRRMSPEEEKQIRVRAVQALWDSTAEQDAKVTALRAELAGAVVPDAKKQELEHQEMILAVLKVRLEEEIGNQGRVIRFANSPIHSTDVRP